MTQRRGIYTEQGMPSLVSYPPTTTQGIKVQYTRKDVTARTT